MSGGSKFVEILTRKGTTLSAKYNIVTESKLSSADDRRRSTIGTGSGSPIVLSSVLKMSKMLFVTALLAPGFAYAGDPSADLSVQVVPAAGTQANFTVTWGTTYQTIDGFGASDAGMSGWNEIGIDPKGWDMLYCVNATDPGCSAPGIGLTFLRRQINIGQTPGSQFFYNAQQVAKGGVG
jgi:hypothetical protein